MGRKNRDCLLTITLIALILPASPCGQKSFIPAPLRLHVPFEQVWEGTTGLLADKDFPLLRKDRLKGLLTTDFQVYSSGLLTESHIKKIGVTPRLIDGEWEQVLYQYEVHLQLVTESETMVTVYTNIEAVAREYLGERRRIKIETNGKLEEKLLEELGKFFFGQGFSLEKPKKGFWEREPIYLPEPGTQTPSIATPERRQ